MAGLADFRAKHPEYNDMSDGALSGALYAKFYSDIPRADFDAKMGIAVPPAAAPEQPEPAPRWDVLGDIGRAAKDAGGALVDDLSAAFPNPTPANPESMDLSPVAELKRMGRGLRVPLDALGVAASPLTGLAHAIGGSALSYVVPTPDKDIDIPGPFGGRMYSDPKRAADQILDMGMMGLGPSRTTMAGGPARAAARQERTEAKLTNKAIARVNARAQEDGLVPDDVFAAQDAASAKGDQITLMDLGNKNVRGLAGAVYRAPGKAGRQIDQFLEGRDAQATRALTGDVQSSLGRGSAYHNSQELFAARSKAAEAPFKAALEADSVAPFESQYRQAVIDANSRKAQIGKQLAKIEREQSGALASRGAAGKATRDKYMQLREEMEGAEAERLAWDERWKQAQSDKTSGAPGAVWSPRLQQFIDHPEVQSGLRTGLKLEKQDAITARRPYKDTDFSIVGMDEKGEPILGQVPTMKSLAVAKEGLDARIAELVDPVTRRPTKAGLSLKNFRNEFVAELDRLNPRYKAARESWSGPSQTIEAIEEGKAHFVRKESNEQVLAEFNQLSEADKDFYRASAAESKVDDLERAPDASDKSKRIINNERDRKRFRMLFKSDAEADSFIRSVARKRTAFDTKQAIKGGSQTAGRIADDVSENIPMGLEAVQGLGNAAGGNWLGAAQSLYRLKRDLGLRNNPALNSEIAGILTNPNLPRGNSGQLLLPLPVPKVDNYFAAPAISSSILSTEALPRKKR